MAVSRYQAEKTIEVFQNDAYFNDIVLGGDISLSTNDYYALAELLHENAEYINSHTIEELANEHPPFLRSEIADIHTEGLDRSYITSKEYRITLYTFKYSTIKNFFRKNYIHFLPEYDYMIIQSNEKMRIFVDAFMAEFDRFVDIIDEMYNIVDVDKVPTEYLNYLAQAVGYEREDRQLLGDEAFRELIKNIVEIYKIKGTAFSFEIFFNFLGFEANIIEFWFDRRFADPNISTNTETGGTNKDNFNFYLTSTKPTRFIPENMRNPEKVTEDQIIGTLDLNEFNQMISDGDYTSRELVGLDPGYPDQPYTFFKTNIVQFDLDAIKDFDTVQGSEGEQLSQEDLATIERYANFLTPIFVQRRVQVNIIPFEENVREFIFVNDNSRPDPRSQSFENNDDDTSNVNDESMFHLYVGLMPSDYYWEDGRQYYTPNIPSVPHSVSSIEPGGYFISGYYNDTYALIWDRSQGSNSVYDQIASNNPSYTEQQIIDEISNELYNETLFSNYSVPDRDLIYPLNTEEINNPSTQSIQFSFRNISPKKLGHKTKDSVSTFKYGDIKHFSVEQNPETFPDLYNKAQIESIDVDNGNDVAEVVLIDDKKRFAQFNPRSNENKIDTLFGDFNRDSKWVENVDYNDTIAPQWTPQQYQVGDLVKDSGATFECIADHDATGDNTLSPIFWKIVSGIRELKVGQLFYAPDYLFAYEITSIDKNKDRIRISHYPQITNTKQTFTLVENSYFFITLKKTNNILNDGSYNVIDVNYNTTDLGGDSFETRTTLTLDKILSGTDQGSTGGYAYLYTDPWVMRDFKYSFLHNYIEMSTS